MLGFPTFTRVGDFRMSRLFLAGSSESDLIANASVIRKEMATVSFACLHTH